MATQVQRRRGTTAQHATFTGAVGELTVDTDKDTVVVHDGSTAGGFALAREDLSNVSTAVKTSGDQTVAGTKTFSSAPVVPGLNGGQLAGVRNKIINGKMEIAQRGTSFAAAANGTYPVDRFAWYSQNTAAVVTVSQQADVPSSNEFQYSARVAVTTADTSIGTTELATLYQIIEGFNARDLIGRTFTLSFWVRSSKTGTHCVSLVNTGSNRSYVAEYTVSAANTWEQKSITVSGGLITAGTWNWTNGQGLGVRWTLAAGSTFQTTANAWQTGDFYTTANQVNCLDSNTNIFAITGVQLEVGSVATPFEHRPYGAELALAQRYYQNYDNQFALVANSAAANANSKTLAIVMRASPTITQTTPSGTGGTWVATSVAIAQVGVHSGDVATTVLKLSAEL
jgi:hypothetical protein